jgi:hypothetical protein
MIESLVFQNAQLFILLAVFISSQAQKYQD